MRLNPHRGFHVIRNQTGKNESFPTEFHTDLEPSPDLRRRSVLGLLCDPRKTTFEPPIGSLFHTHIHLPPNKQVSIRPISWKPKRVSLSCDTHRADSRSDRAFTRRPARISAFSETIFGGGIGFFPPDSDGTDRICARSASRRAPSRRPLPWVRLSRTDNRGRAPDSPRSVHSSPQRPPPRTYIDVISILPARFCRRRRQNGYRRQGAPFHRHLRSRRLR